MTDVKGKVVFLSGPMSDDPEKYHVHEFVDAQLALYRAGAKEVYNPALEWIWQACEEHSHAYWMRVSIQELTQRSGYVADDEPARFDLLVCMPGWNRSEGARTERMVAEACGIECVELSEVV